MNLIPFKKTLSRAFYRFAMTLARSAKQLPVWAGRRSTPFSTSRDLKSYLEAMKLSPWLAVGMFRKGDAIKSAIKAMEIKFISSGEDVPEDDPAVQMVKVKPNRWDNAERFYELTTWHRFLTGRAYWNLRPMLNKKALEMWVWYPNRVKMEPDETGKEIIKEYQYKLGGDKVLKAKPEEMVYLRGAHPTDPLSGLGVVEAGETTIESFIAMDHSANQFFSNGLNLGSVFETEETIEDEERTSFEKHLAQTFAGADNAHKFMLLDAGMKWKDAGTSPREAEWSQSRKDNRDVQNALTGTLPLQAGVIEGSNRQTAWVQRTEYERRTIQPWLDELIGYINIVLKPHGMVATMPPIVTEDNEEDANIASKYLENSMLTPNEGRTRFLGLPKVEGVPGMDKFYMRSNLIPLEDVALEPLPANADTEPTAIPKPPKPKLSVRQQKTKRISRRIQQKLLRMFIRERAIAEREGRRVIRKLFEDQKRRVLQKWKQAHGIRMMGAKELRQTVEDLFSPFNESEAWSEAMAGFWGATLSRGAKNTGDVFDITVGVEFAPGQPAFDRKVKGMAEGVVNIQANTQQRLSSVIAKGVGLGLNPTQIANGDPSIGYKGITGTFDSMQKHRAQLIARADSAKALDRGNAEIFKKLGSLEGDITGCEDDVIMPGEEYGCSSVDVPMSQAEKINFHPNHTGALVPSLASIGRMAKAGTLRGVEKRIDRHRILWYKRHK